MDIISLLNFLPPVKPVENYTLYSRAKNGALLVYQIMVDHYEDHSTLTTIKKRNLKGKEQTDVYEYYEGVHIGKSNELSFSEKATFDSKSMINKLMDGGFSFEIPPEGRKTGANGVILPMLASEDTSKIIFPCMAQPKYDGVRCTITKDFWMRSRKGKEYSAPHIEQFIKDNMGILPLDGEIYSHKKLDFEGIVSAIKKSSDKTSQLSFVVYDKPIENLTWRERSRLLHEDYLRYGKIEGSPIIWSKSRILLNMEELQNYHDLCVEEGYEGVIVRNFKGEYLFGYRSEDLIKYKEFMEEEFQIVGVLEATGRDKGTAIFQCSVGDDFFNVRPMGDKECRADYLDRSSEIIGKFVTVKFQGYTKYGKPRFPSAKTIRDYE